MPFREIAEPVCAFSAKSQTGKEGIDDEDARMMSAACTPTYQMQKPTRELELDRNDDKCNRSDPSACTGWAATLEPVVKVVRLFVDRIFCVGEDERLLGGVTDTC